MAEHRWSFSEDECDTLLRCFDFCIKEVSQYADSRSQNDIVVFAAQLSRSKVKRLKERLFPPDKATP